MKKILLIIWSKFTSEGPRSLKRRPMYVLMSLNSILMAPFMMFIACFQNCSIFCIKTFSFGWYHPEIFHPRRNGKKTLKINFFFFCPLKTDVFGGFLNPNPIPFVGSSFCFPKIIWCSVVYGKIDGEHFFVKRHGRRLTGMWRECL